MKKFLYIAVFASLLSACTADFDREISGGKATNYADKIINSSNNAQSGEILVCFDATAESRLAECATRSGATRSGIAGVDAILDEVGGYSVKPVFMVTEKNRDKVHSMGMHLWYTLSFDKGEDLNAVAVELAKVGEVKYVEFSKIIKRITPKQPASASKKSDTKAPQTRVYSSLVSDIPFDDTYKAYQWGLDNQGTKSQVTYYGSGWELYEPITDADVNAVPAWKLCKGDPSIVVAIVDEGVMYTHEDLASNYLVNTAELNGDLGIDDDFNGYIDDIYGFNFVSYSGTISWNNIADTGHGTHVAGIVSAVNNNGIGISSIAGGSGNNDGVKLFSAQIFSGENGTTTNNTAAAIQYAADQGAHILQCSWGYPSAATEGVDSSQLGPENDFQFTYYMSVESKAIDYFIKYGGTADGPIDGGLVIFAAGNEGAPLPSYPSAYEPCISVASIGPALRPTYYTNYYYGTDICAPGGTSLYSDYDGTPCTGEILSTVPKANSTSGLSGYGMMQGTSMACPMVSGVAALGLSYAKQLGKRYTANEFRSMLLSATNDTAPYFTGGITLSYTDGSTISYYYPDYIGKMGAGSIDAYKLLLQVEGTPYVTIVAGENSQIDLSQYFGSGIANMAFSGISVASEEASAIGLSSSVSYSDGILGIKCTNSGTATITVEMLVGGGSTSDSTKPYPTKVTKSFVLMVRSSLASNNGWL